MLKSTSFLLLVAFVALAAGKVFFEERFNDPDVFKRWIKSKAKEDLGEFVLDKSKVSVHEKEDQGIKTSQDAKFYHLSTKFDKFSNKGKNLVIQFTVKHEQGIDCGGGYVKLFSSDVDPESFHGESKYNIMFGPDICGMSKKVHVIFTNKDKNHLVKKEIRCKDDEKTHMYRLIVKPTNEYEVQIDDEKVESGTLEDDFDILPPKEIEDESIKKPDDWVDEEMMDDKDDKKPEDWDKPKTIADPNAKKPDDWDDEMDGEWEAPQIDNPDYKGDWKPKKIKNPDYKGPWVQPRKKNPDYYEDKELYSFEDFGGLGFDVWQVKSGTIFDNIAICDDVDECKGLTVDIWKARQEAEKKKEEEEAKKREEEAKQKEAEEKAKKEEEEKTKKEDDEEKAHDEL